MVNQFLSFLNTLLHEDGQLSGVVVRDNNGALVRWGINQAAWPGIDVPHLTFEDAIRLCYARLWPPGLNLIESQMIGNAVYDVEFNNGRGNGVKLLQRAAGVNVDGVIGPVTVTAVTTDLDAVRTSLKLTIEEHYREIAAKNPAESQYLMSWLARVDKNFEPLV